MKKKLILYFCNVVLLHSGVEKKNLINFELQQQQNPHMKNLSECSARTDI